ncbi:hypothetical protein BGX28_002678 [Mortierella sp. GBA30]|nr:hypothetical protein BGX28_002678 [Mortierella sp. GBA30]
MGVEEICGVRNIGTGQKPEFNVKWLGYPYSSNTWEPIENLENCLNLVRDHLLTFGMKQMDLNVSQDSKGLGVSAASSSSSTPQSSSSSSTSSAVSWEAQAENTTTDRSSITSIASSYQTSQETALKTFEDMLNVSPGPRITVENNVDDAACPPGFKYINHPIYGKNVKPPDVAFASFCSCPPGKCSIEFSCSCLDNARAENEYDIVPFKRDSRVRKRASNLLWECSDLCGCGPNCISKASQRGRQFAMKLKRFPVKGWGVVLDGDVPIPPRTFVSRYVGEIITVREADERGKAYEKLGVTYLFDLDYNADQEAVYSIDAFHQGNESRFFNHSCDPNLSVYNLTGGDYAGNTDLMTLSFWSNRHIEPGDELTFDYNGIFVQEWFKEEGSSRNERRRTGHAEKRTPCACGAINCQKWVHL